MISAMTATAISSGASLPRLRPPRPGEGRAREGRTGEALRFQVAPPPVHHHDPPSQCYALGDDGDGVVPRADDYKPDGWPPDLDEDVQVTGVTRDRAAAAAAFPQAGA